MKYISCIWSKEDGVKNALHMDTTPIKYTNAYYHITLVDIHKREAVAISKSSRLLPIDSWLCRV